MQISTRAYADHYELVVRDHGAGVPEPDLDCVLRPFVRLDAARGGTAHSGLGLTIVRRLVRHHDGTLQISSASDGGLVIAMTFPGRSRTTRRPGAGQLS